MTDLTNKRFGRLTVVKQDSYHVFPSGKRKIKWLCQCDCGNKISVIASDLNNSHTRSCGCLRRETTKSLKERSDETGIAYSCLFYRLNAGWNIADALTIPSRKHTSTEITQ